MNTAKSISLFLPNTRRAWLAIVLISLIGLFETIKTIHIDHHHGNEITTCTASEETDACHRSLVHLDSTNGCNHKQHLEKNITSCEICEALISVHVFEAPTSIQPSCYFFETLQFSSTLEKPNTAPIITPHLRGPPSLS